MSQETTELSEANKALRAEIAMRRRYAERLESLREIDVAILAAESPKAIAEAALRRLHSLLPCEHASLVELDPESRRAILLASVDGGELKAADGWHLSKEQMETARVLSSGKLHRIVNSANLFHVTAGGAGDSPVIWPLIVDVPLIVGDTLVGVLNLATHSPAAFAPELEEIAQELAMHLAVVIRQARLFTQISMAREQLRALSLRLVEVQEAERRFLAHELHDEIGQLLTGLKITLELTAGERTAQSSTSLNEAIAMVDDLMNRVRQLSLDLHPQVLDDLGLLPALDWLFKRYFKQTGVRVHFKHTTARGRLAPPLERAAFRITQEALTNIARHAGVKEATVRLWSDGSRLRLQVEDQGTGFLVEPVLNGGATSGVAGMRERALVLRGEFTLDSAPGAGTRLTVELPLDHVPVSCVCSEIAR